MATGPRRLDDLIRDLEGECARLRKQLAVLIERVDAYDERIQETRKTLERTSRMLKDAKRTRKT